MSLWPAPRDVAVVHQATTEFEAISVRAMLEAAGLRAVIRSRLVPGYNVPTLAGGQGGIIADILVPLEHEAQARALVADYLAGLEEGGGPPAAAEGPEDPRPLDPEGSEERSSS